MASAINISIPPYNTGLISAAVRSNFATASSEITALQNQLLPLQSSIGALQTKTTVSGDGSLTANGALTITALRGRTVSATAPAVNQVLGWSGSQWVPITVTGGGGSGTVNAGIVGQIGIYAANGNTISGVAVSGDGSLAANGALTVTRVRGQTLATTTPTNGQVLTWVQGTSSWTPVTPAAGGAGVIPTTATAPASPVNGQLWWDATAGGLYVWYNDGTSSQWVIASPSGGGGVGGSSNALSLTGGTLSGSLAVNTSGLGLPVAAAGNVLQLASSGNTNMAIDAAGATAVPRLQMRRAQGSLSAPQVVGSNNELGMLEWQGWTGTQWAGGGNIHCRSGPVAWTAGSAPTQMNFQTTRSSGVNPITAMYIGTAGGLVVGSPGGADQGPGTINVQNLYVDADLWLNGTINIQGTPLTIGPPDSGGSGFRAFVIPN